MRYLPVVSINKCIPFKTKLYSHSIIFKIIDYYYIQFLGKSALFFTTTIIFCSMLKIDKN